MLRRFLTTLCCRQLLQVGILTALCSPALLAAEEAKEYVRLASGVSGHIHPAACVAKSGRVLVIFGQSDYKDLRLCRSSDGGRACPKTVQLDKETLGTVFYDVDEKQPGGPGVFFLRTPLAKLEPRGK